MFRVLVKINFLVRDSRRVKIHPLKKRKKKVRQLIKYKLLSK